MLKFDDKSLLFLTKLLRSRLIRPNHIDINILSPSDAFSTTSLDEYYGSSLGYFFTNPRRGLCFLYYTKDSSTSTWTHVICFYFGSNLRKIQSNEVKHYSKRNDNNILIEGIVNIKSSASSDIHLSIFIQTLEFTLGPNLMDPFIPHQIIEVRTGTSLLSFNPNLYEPACNLPNYDTDIQNVWSLMISHEEIRRLPFATEMDGFSKAFLYRLGCDGHYVYGIPYVPKRTLVLLIPHSFLFRSQEDVDSCVAKVNRYLGVQFENIYVLE